MGAGNWTVYCVVHSAYYGCVPDYTVCGTLIKYGTIFCESRQTYRITSRCDPNAAAFLIIPAYFFPVAAASIATLLHCWLYELSTFSNFKLSINMDDIAASRLYSCGTTKAGYRQWARCRGFKIFLQRHRIFNQLDQSSYPKRRLDAKLTLYYCFSNGGCSSNLMLLTWNQTDLWLLFA